MRKSTDVLVLYDMADMDGENERGHLREFLDAGKGMVVLHHAVIDNQHWQWWYEEVTGGRYLLAPEGNQRASTYQHDVPMTVRATGKHPITEGLGEFPIVDKCTTSWRSPRARAAGGG
jgi:type 1 glutamine amidotransferase